MTVASPAHTLSPARSREHIIDVLIAERAPKLAAGPGWPLLRPLLYAFLDYAKARRMADAIQPLPGRAALEHVSKLLSVQVTAAGLEHVPRRGRLIVVCNHPTGIADGVAVYDLLKTVRPDLCFYANSDAHRVAPGLRDVLIPVEWVEAKRTRERTRETLLLTREALEAERCVVIFPSGRLARRQPDGTLRDPPWAPSAVSLARKYETPIVPLHVAGPWSRLFHFFNRFSSELRDVTLFHEFLNKQGRNYALTIGRPVAPDVLDGEPTQAIARLKAFVETALPGRSGPGLRMILPDEAATARLGAAIARVLRPGEAVCLSGPLGAGKSTLARALIRALTSPDEDVPSPTFTLVQFYEGARLKVAHFDLYRLTSADEAYEIGLDEALDDGAAVIEWPERLDGHLPGDRLDIEIALEGAGRSARLTPYGAWEGREIES